MLNADAVGQVASRLDPAYNSEMQQPDQAISRKLSKVYSLLRRHFGYAPQWWPGSSLEISLTAILVQQCDWSAAWKGVRRLSQEGLLDLRKLAAVKPAAVQPCIREVAFAPTKSRRLVQFARALLERGHEKIETYLAASRPTQELRQDLLSLKGIGKETADCILLYASEHATFVVDAYTRRACQRLDLFPQLDKDFWSGPYNQLQEFFASHIFADLSLYACFEFAGGVPFDVALFRDFHAQLVELGKHHCLKTNPRCHGCGQRGWPGYAICESHCSAVECTACPLASLCAAGHAGSKDARLRS